MDKWYLEMKLAAGLGWSQLPNKTWAKRDDRGCTHYNGGHLWQEEISKRIYTMGMGEDQIDLIIEITKEGRDPCFDWNPETETWEVGRDISLGVRK